MRSNNASDDCNSTEVRSSVLMGKYSRVCRVVKATMVPAVKPPGPKLPYMM